MHLTNGTCFRVQILQMKGNIARHILTSTCTIFANFEWQNMVPRVHQMTSCLGQISEKGTLSKLHTKIF